MVEFRWIIFALLPMLEFSLTATPSIYSLEGNDVTLSCENVTPGQDQCGRTMWLLSDSRKSETLSERGRIVDKAKAKDRLSVTEKCSLVVKKVTAEDGGRYSCRHFKSGQSSYSDSSVYLSVVSMTEQKHKQQVTLSCSVSTYGRCSAEWLCDGREEGLGSPHTTRYRDSCSATVTFTASQFHLKLHKSLKCKVTHDDSRTEQQFPFSPPQSSGEETGKESTMATAATPVTTGSTWTTRTEWTSETTENLNPSDGTNETAATSDDHGAGPSYDAVWPFIVVPVASAALFIIAAAVIKRRRANGNETLTDENKGRSLNPAEAQSGPEPSQDAARPEEGVAYASISYTRTTDRQARARGDNDEAVTYSTVRAASADPSVLYATVNERKK